MTEQSFGLARGIAVGAVVRRAGRVLLVRRANPPSRGLWAVPGGRVEPGEALEAAVRREVLEETGLEVRVDGFLGVVERPDPGAGVHWIIVEFAASIVDGTPRDPVPGDDASEAAWFDEDGLEDDGEVVRGVVAFLRRHRP